MSTQIHDLGYRAYDGERAGVGWAVRSLVVHSIRRALGLKRAARHKIAPCIALLLAFGPAIVLTVGAAFLGAELASEFPGYGEYFSTTGFAQFLFAAAVIPGVLTTDRTNGMLALYLASPLTRTTYIAARIVGIFLVMLIVALGPILVLIFGYTFVGAGPGGVGAVLEILGRALVAGTLTAALFSGFGALLSSLPRRWGLASLAIVGVTLVTSGLAEGLSASIEDLTDWIMLVSPSDVVVETAERIMDDRATGVRSLDALPTWPLALAAVGWTCLTLVASWWRYQTIKVER